MQYLPNNNITFQELYEREALIDLEQNFLDFLAKINPDILDKFMAARTHVEQLAKKDESQLLIDMAPYVEKFLAHLFNIEQVVEDHCQQQAQLSPIYVCKRNFIQKRVAKSFVNKELKDIDPTALRHSLQELFQGSFSDLAFASHILQWMSDPKKYDSPLQLASLYAAWAIFTKEGRLFHEQSALFKIPEKRDPLNLVHLEAHNQNDVDLKRSPTLQHRDGFALTDLGISMERALDQANYCIWCHNQGKDSCSKGLTSKDESQRFEQSLFQESLAG